MIELVEGGRSSAAIVWASRDGRSRQAGRDILRVCTVRQCRA